MCGPPMATELVILNRALHQFPENSHRARRLTTPPEEHTTPPRPATGTAIRVHHTPAGPNPALVLLGTVFLNHTGKNATKEEKVAKMNEEDVSVHSPSLTSRL